MTPSEIQAIAHIKTKNKSVLKETPLKVYTAQEYEKKLTSNAYWAAALYGLGQGFANTPIATTTTYSGYLSSGQYVYGTVHQQPSYADRVVANAITQSNINNFVSGIYSSNANQSSVLARQHTIKPKRDYGGVVHILKKNRYKASYFDLIIPVGNEKAKVSFYFRDKLIYYTAAEKI